MAKKFFIEGITGQTPIKVDNAHFLFCVNRTEVLALGIGESCIGKFHSAGNSEAKVTCFSDTKHARFTISTHHGESKTLHYVVDAKKDEIVATFHTHSEAEAYIYGRILAKLLLKPKY